MNNITVEAIAIVVALELTGFIKGIFTKGFIEPLQGYLFKRLFNRGELTFEEIESLVKKDCGEIDRIIRGYFGSTFGIVADGINYRNLSGSDRQRYRELLNKTYSVTKLIDGD